MTGGVRYARSEADNRCSVGTFTSKSFLGLPNATPGASPFLDGYTTVDIFSSYKVAEDVNVALTVTNVGDVAYTPALSSGGITNTANPIPVETGRGRTFLLTTRAQF